MDYKEGPKEDHAPEELASDEKEFSASVSENMFENVAITSQHYYEMDKKVNIRGFDSIEKGLPIERKLCSIDAESSFGNNTSTECSVFEMNQRIKVKEEIDISDTSLQNESFCFSAGGNKFKNEDLGCASECELNTSVESKQQTFVLDSNFQKDFKCFSSVLVKKIKKESVTYNENGEMRFQILPAAECQLEVPTSIVLQQNENIDNKAENLESEESSRNHALTPMSQLLVALRFYATGGMLTSVGDFCGVHKVTAGAVVHKVSAAISSLARQYIKMPQGDEIQDVQAQFYRLAAFPRSIGSLDCTHIRIKSPGGDTQEIFRNRKGFFSLNVQTVCDVKLRITDIVVRWPGSTHDVTIFNNSVLKARLDRGDFGNSVLIGDSGYAPGLHLLPPLRNPAMRAQQLYKESLIRTRNAVERQYGVWKACFPVLALGIRQKLENVQALIVACAVMHNLAINNNEQLPLQDPEMEHVVRHAIQERNIPVAVNENGPEAVRETFIQHSQRML